MVSTTNISDIYIIILSEEATKWNSRIATKVFVASSRFNDVKFNNYLRKLRSFIISKRPIYGNVR